MTKERLNEHLQKIIQLKIVFKKAQDEWIAYNQLFNSEMQEHLGLTDDKTELHLTEILTAWDKLN